MGDCLHKVLGQTGSELWFPWQQIAPIGYNGENLVTTLAPSFFHWIFFILADNKNNHIILNGFEIWQELAAHERLENPHRLIMGDIL